MASIGSIGAAIPLLVVVSAPALAQFTAEQNDAFLRGAGTTGDDLTSLITFLVVVLALIGVAWMAVTAYQSWADRQMTAFSFVGLLLRASALLTLVSVFLS